MGLRKTVASILALVCGLGALSLTSCDFGKEPANQFGTQDDFLTADGEEVKNAKGEKVMLRGINAGGLMVTEHWMTGFRYGSTPSNDYRSLTQTFLERFGEEKTKNLWAEYRKNWWSDEDFAACKEMGFNVIRLPFTYMNVDFAAVSDLKAAGKHYDFTVLDDFIAGAQKHGLYTILDLHGAYGSQNGQDHSGQIFGSASEVTFYSDETLMSLTENLWAAIANRYKDNAAVAGYDILNEPGEKAGTTSERHWAFYDRAYKAIRKTGDKHLIIFESCWNGENMPDPKQKDWTNCMYSFHHYAGDQLGSTEYCLNWNEKLAEVSSFRFGVPIQMGEFTSYGSAANWEYTLDLLNRSNWHWASWTYKVCGNMPWGVVNVRLSNEDKVNASEDSYEEILRKFSLLRTEQAVDYRFSDARRLRDIYRMYTAAPTTDHAPDEGEYRFSCEQGYIAVESGAVRLTEDYNAARKFRLTARKANDGSFTFAAGGGYLSVESTGALILSSEANNSARFYAANTDEGLLLVSYSLSKYVRVNENGALVADATRANAARFLYE